MAWWPRCFPFSSQFATHVHTGRQGARALRPDSQARRCRAGGRGSRNLEVYLLYILVYTILYTVLIFNHILIHMLICNHMQIYIYTYITYIYSRHRAYYKCPSYEVDFEVSWKLICIAQIVSASLKASFLRQSAWLADRTAKELGTLKWQPSMMKWSSWTFEVFWFAGICGQPCFVLKLFVGVSLEKVCRGM